MLDDLHQTQENPESRGWTDLDVSRNAREKTQRLIHNVSRDNVENGGFKKETYTVRTEEKKKHPFSLTGSIGSSFLVQKRKEEVN